MAPYLEKPAAQTRLEDYGIPADSSALVTIGDLRVASNELDSMAPFKGDKVKGAVRQFPRQDADGIPDEVLDWVALRAFQIGSNENPPVISEGAGRVQVTYATPKISQTLRRMGSLIRPHLQRSGRITAAYEPEGVEYVAPGKF